MTRDERRAALSPRDQQLLYAADHMVGSIAFPEDAHAGDSKDLAFEVFEQVAVSVRREIDAL